MTPLEVDPRECFVRIAGPGRHHGFVGGEGVGLVGEKSGDGGSGGGGGSPIANRCRSEVAPSCCALAVRNEKPLHEPNFNLNLMERG